MSYPITLIYPDGDEASTTKGDLFLPGAPVDIPEGMSGCSLCGYRVDEVEDARSGEMVNQDPGTGAHAGIIAISYDPTGGDCPDVMEYVHLRCVMDSGQQYHTVGFITEAAEYPSTGKHRVQFASA